MGLFQKALETYDAMEHLAGVATEGKETLAPVGHIIAKATIEITVDDKGNFIRAKRIDERIPIPCTEASAGRTSGVVPHPLCDNLGYISGIDPKKKNLFIEGLKSWSESESGTPKLKAILSYVEKGNILHDLIHSDIASFDDNEKLKNEKEIVTWRVEGLGDESGAVYEDRALQDSFSKFYLQNISSNKNICMITGEETPAASLHLKGIVNIHGNAKLISGNDTRNFTFKGRFADDKEASSIGYISSQKAHNALKWLVSNEGVQIGQRKFVCWNPHGYAVPKITSPLFSFDEKDGDKMPTTYKRRLQEALMGFRNNLPDSEGVIIAAFDAATNGRLALTYYNELLGSDFLDRLYAWDITCCWNSRKWGTTSPSLYQIINCAFGTQQGSEDNAKIVTHEKVLGQQIQRLITCRIDKALFPKDIMRRLVQKTANLHNYTVGNRENMLVTTCAVIRKSRIDHYKEEWDMALETDKKDRSYQYGRILAILEKIERDTYDKGEERETNAIRSQAFFVQRPMAAVDQILKQLKTGYYPKLGPAARVYYDRLIGEAMEIISAFGEAEIGKPLTETYLMGYYLQKNALYTKKEAEKKEEDK